MSSVTLTDQTQVNECAREYVRLAQERADRLEKLIMVAIMELTANNPRRAHEVLLQALNS